MGIAAHLEEILDLLERTLGLRFAYCCRSERQIGSAVLWEGLKGKAKTQESW